MFCNFDISKRLCEAGFNDCCGHVYDVNTQKVMAVENIPDWDNYRGALNEQLPEDYISAPELHEAIDWLRKKKGFYIYAKPEGAFFYVHINKKKDNNWEIHTNVFSKLLQSSYKDPNKALEAGLKYVVLD